MMPEHQLESTTTAVWTEQPSARETTATGESGLDGLLVRAADDTTGGTMPRADLLAMVKALRNERGPTHDTAAYLLLMEVALFLEDTETARSVLLQRVTTFLQERCGTHDPVLLLLMAEVAVALRDEIDAKPAQAVGFCELCAAEGGGCAVCGK